VQNAQSIEKRMITGAASGLLATFPMSVAMYAMQRLMPVERYKSMAPKKITVRMARKVGLEKQLGGRKRRNALTTLSHFGYGAAAGAIYAPMTADVQSSPIVKGAIFGFALWAGSYRGWLPAVNIWKPRMESSKRRTVMVVSHLVWGVALGALVDRLERRTSNGTYI
jgi:putative membrane protein